MNTLDVRRALVVGLAVFAGTMLLSVLLVMGYSLAINPGHTDEYYRSAATWIAPWASHVGGPALFFLLNYRHTRHHEHARPVPFALATIGSYVLFDLASVPLFGLRLATVLTLPFFVSLAVKLSGALGGAILGARASRSGSA